jgi:hypothetical protein
MIDEAMRKTTAHPAFDNVKLLNWERASRIAAVICFFSLLFFVSS